MARSYNILHHWNEWLAHHFLGSSLLEAEAQALSALLKPYSGKFAVTIGVPRQQVLSRATSQYMQSVLMTPLAVPHYSEIIIEGDYFELPFLNASVDLVLLPHTMELVDNPRQLLAEACRMVKPQGLVVIYGFNPFSTWGIKKVLAKNKGAPWAGQFIHAKKVCGWLKLADYKLELQQGLMYRPPIQRAAIFKKMHAFEGLGNLCCPFLNGVYILLARAQQVPLTPIRMRYKQHVAVSATSHMSGYILR